MVTRRDPSVLEAGLYLVATPIGAARDITLRALDILRVVDVLAVEDTRVARRLLSMHGIARTGRPLIAYHDRNDEAVRPIILAHLRTGRSVAYLPDAGTPMVSDPGFELVRAAIGEGLPVSVAPGPSSVLAALLLSGLPTDRFLFAGFPARRRAARCREFESLADCPATLVFCVSAGRLSAVLADMVDRFGGERRAAICRELTKMFEQVQRGTLHDLQAGQDSDGVKGELVIVVDRPQPRRVDEATILAELRAEKGQYRPSEAARQVAERLGAPRRQVYQLALSLADDDE